MADYNTKNMFDSYSNIETSYGPFIPGQNVQNSYHVQAQQKAVAEAQYNKPFRTTHASRVDY